MRASPIFIAAIALWAVAMPATVQAQQPKRLSQLALLLLPPPAGLDPVEQPVFRASHARRIEGAWLCRGPEHAFELRIATKPEKRQAMARDLVERNVDIIVAVGHSSRKPPSARPTASRSSSWIAIALTGGRHARQAGRKRHRNGVPYFVGPCGKRLQLLQQIVPRLSRVAVLFNGGVQPEVDELQDIVAAAKTLEIEVQPADVRDASGFAAAFVAIKGRNPQALIALAEPAPTFQHIKEIAAFAAEQRLPSTYGFREFCDVGGLLCYGSKLSPGSIRPLRLFHRQDIERRQARRHSGRGADGARADRQRQGGKIARHHFADLHLDQRARVH